MPTDAPARSALAKAFAAQHAASLEGFDWDDPRDALEKVLEEAEEVGALLADGDATGADRAPGTPDAAAPPTAPHAASRLREELGDLLFAVVNVARLAGVEPRAALDRATAKFDARFAEVQRLARLRGVPMPGAPLAELDRLWDEVKAGAEASPSASSGSANRGCTD